jgi:small subunit ribosomal protein S11
MAKHFKKKSTPQRVESVSLLKKNKQIGTIHIQSTRNNTILTLTDKEGKTKSWTSSGFIGFKNSRKSTSYAAQAAAEKMAHIARKLGFFFVNIKMKGLGYGKKNSVRALYRSGLTLLKIQDITPIPHNGCRVEKKRRV